MATRSIKLVRETNFATFVSGRGDSVRMRVSALDVEGLQPEIFIHKKSLLNPHAADPTPNDEFVCIASPFDLSIYPVGEPNPAQWPPFFLKSSIDIVVASTSMALESWKFIQEDVQGLLNAYYRMELLKVDAEVILDAPASDDYYGSAMVRFTHSAPTADGLLAVSAHGSEAFAKPPLSGAADNTP